MSTVKKSVAVYGGSFDPLTTAHLGVISAVVASGRFEEVWVVPCGRRRDKATLVASPQERLIMCHLGVETGGYGPCVKVLAEDVAHGGPAMSTVELSRKLRRPELELTWVIGADLAGSLGEWRDVEALMAECKFLVHPRPGYDIPPELEGLGGGGEAVAISSTAARAALEGGDHRAGGMVPAAVASYIARYGLYAP